MADGYPSALTLFLERSKVVDDVPDVGVLELIAERNHVQLRRDAVLDRREDLAVGRAVLPRLAGEIGRGRDEIVSGPAFGVRAVATGAVALVEPLSLTQRLGRRRDRILDLSRLRI